MRRVFRLLKDSPELKAGAIAREKCDNGDQPFEVINAREYAAEDDIYLSGWEYSRKVVLNHPEWFEEVFTLEELGYLTKAEFQKIKGFLEGGINNVRNRKTSPTTKGSEKR